MEYQKAKDVRGTSFGNLMAKKLIEGGGIGGSLGATISEKTKATMTGIKQSFDPLNMAKFMTGGSSLGPALLGKIMGRSKKDIKFFAGKTRKGRDTASKLSPIESGGDFASILYNIENLLKSSLEEDKLQRARENNFAEEKELERLRRHKELMEAITGKKYDGKASATKIKRDAEESGGSIIDDIVSAFGLKEVGKLALKGLGSLATFALGPIGAPLLAAAAVGAFGYFIYKALKAEPSYEAEQEAKGIKQAQEVGGLAGVKDEMDKRKSLPEYDRTMAEIKDYEKIYNEGEKLSNTQLDGFAKRGPGALEAVEDYKVERDKSSGQTSSTSQPITTTPAPAPAATTVNQEPAAVDTPNMGSALQSVQSQNLDMKIPVSNEDPSIAISNTTKVSNTSTKEKNPLPPVRNLEETFQRMILYSTRVV